MTSKWLWWGAVTLALLPVYAFFLLLCLLLAALPLNPTRVCRQNLRRRLGASSVQVYLITTGVWMNYAFYVIELVVLWPLGALIETNQEDYVHFMLQVAKSFGLRESGAGFFFLGGHFSVIEQAGGTMNAFLRSHHIGEVSVLAKPARTRVLTAVLDGYRKWRRFSVIWTRSAAQVRADMKKALAKGNSIALVNDQKARKGGVFIQFFGAYASFPFRGIDLVKEHPVACVTNNTRRLLPGVFRMEYALMPNPHLSIKDPEALQHVQDSVTFRPAPLWEASAIEERSSCPKETVDPRVSLILSHYVGWLEAVVRKSPYQWCWDYRKWSRLPPGQTTAHHRNRCGGQSAAPAPAPGSAEV